MKNKIFRATVAVLLFAFVPFFVSANEENMEFYLRWRYQIPAHIEIKEATQMRINNAKARLAQNSKDANLRRDLGDAYHSMAHLLEEEKRYAESKVYSLKSLAVFKTTTAKSRESYDGLNHALEHGLMDLYDLAVELERKGLKKEAIRQYQAVSDFFETNQMHEYMGAYGDRVEPRYGTLLARKKELGIKKTAADKIYEQRLCEEFLTGLR